MLKAIKHADGFIKLVDPESKQHLATISANQFSAYSNKHGGWSTNLSIQDKVNLLRKLIK